MRSRSRLAISAALITAAAGVMWNRPATLAEIAPPPATAPADRPAPVLKAEVMATNLRAPWALAFAPDGRVFFTEREGRVRLLKGGKLVERPMLTVPDIKSWSKMGLLGLALDPDFAINHFVYLGECHGDEKNNWLRVVRDRETDDTLVEPKTLLDEIPAFHNHAGGRLRLGPNKKLYVTTGDSDKPLLAQRLDSLAGKILRLNPDGTIPADNPFVARPGARPEIYSYGHRNAQGLAFQPVTHALYAPEHGPDGGDEINLVLPGQNYGWPTISHDRSKEGMLSPLVQFTPSVGPADAVFYDGGMFPNLKGDLIVAAMRGEALLRVRFDGEEIVGIERLLFKQFGRLREVAVAPDGALWVTTSEFDPPEGRKNPDYDQLLRLTPTGDSLAAVDRPPSGRELPKAVGPAAQFAQSCAACHGTTAFNPLQPSLFDNTWHFGDTDAAIRHNIESGLIDRGMPAYQGKLTPAEIDALVVYIREREK